MHWTQLLVACFHFHISWLEIHFHNGLTLHGPTSFFACSDGAQCACGICMLDMWMLLCQVPRILSTSTFFNQTLSCMKQNYEDVSVSLLRTAKPKAYPGQATPGYCQDMGHTLAMGYVWHISWPYPGVAWPGYVFDFAVSSLSLGPKLDWNAF